MSKMSLRIRRQLSAVFTSVLVAIVVLPLAYAQDDSILWTYDAGG